LTESIIARYRAAVEEELNEAVAFAEASPSPLPEDCLKGVFAQE
jgi:TPP-dependent pyruvate/acetoin dehydrogenase alpha subunit